jgi:hypothetical protein
MIEEVTMHKITCDCCGKPITFLDDSGIVQEIVKRLRSKKVDWTMPCGHHMCYDCVDHVNKTVCPICNPNEYGVWWCLKHWVMIDERVMKCHYRNEKGTKRGFKECKIVPYSQWVRTRYRK